MTNIIALEPRPRCPCCQSATRSIVHDFPEIPVVRCSDCGQMYSSMLMRPADLNAYYRNSFGSERHRKGQIVNAAVNFPILLRLLDGRLPTTYLEVGCGYGYLASKLQEAGTRVAAVELSSQEADYARNELGVNVFNGPLVESPHVKGSFDVVASFEVIEHVPDPIELLAQMAFYIKPGGYLIIGTDNFASSACRAMGPTFPKWIPHSHVTHFEVSTLQRCIHAVPSMASRAVFSYTPWELFPRTVKARLRQHDSAAASFNLAETLQTEMGGTYRFFHLRKLVNSMWAMLQGGPGHDGAMIFVAAQKVDTTSSLNVQ